MTLGKRASQESLGQKSESQKGNDRSFIYVEKLFPGVKYAAKSERLRKNNKKK